MTGLGNKAIFARNLKRYIEQSGKTRKELADIWGFPYSTVTEWLTEKKYPRIDRVEIIADYFGILKSDLIEDKMTDEKEADNEAMAGIIVRLRMDGDFMELVKELYALDTEKINSVRQMLQAFNK